MPIVILGLDDGAKKRTGSVQVEVVGFRKPMRQD
jgi:hypothetical protein